MIPVQALLACLLSFAFPGWGTGQAPLQVPLVEEPPITRSEDEWRLREMELMARIRSLELELVQQRALRMEREREWLEFSKLLALLPEEKRPELPAFLRKQDDVLPSEESSSPSGPTAEERQNQKDLERAAEIKTILRAYLRAEGMHALDLLEVGLVGDGFIGPIVARQLDDQGRFLATLVADRLRLEKSQSGFTLTLVLEQGYERRAGQIWPFPTEHHTSVAIPDPTTGAESVEQAQRSGILRIPLAGVSPEPWIEALPELFSARDLDRKVNDGVHDAFALRYSLNALLGQPRQGGRWRLVSLGGVVGTQWRDIHLAELALDGRVVRRLFADRGQLSLQGDNLMFALESGAQERGATRSPFLAGRYTLVLTHVDREAWLASGLPGIR